MTKQELIKILEERIEKLIELDNEYSRDIDVESFDKLIEINAKIQAYTDIKNLLENSGDSNENN